VPSLKGWKNPAQGNALGIRSQLWNALKGHNHVTRSTIQKTSDLAPFQGFWDVLSSSQGVALGIPAQSQYALKGHNHVTRSTIQKTSDLAPFQGFWDVLSSSQGVALGWILGPLRGPFWMD